MDSPVLLDPIGRPPSPATLPGHFAGRRPRNAPLPGRPATRRGDRCGDARRGRRTFGRPLTRFVVVLWRAGLRLGEALALVESDLDPTRGPVLVRHGKGDKRRESGMDDWGWE